MDLRVHLWGKPSYFPCGSDKQFIPFSIGPHFFFFFWNANSLYPFHPPPLFFFFTSRTEYLSTELEKVKALDLWPRLISPLGLWMSSPARVQKQIESEGWERTGQTDSPPMWCLSNGHSLWSDTSRRAFLFDKGHTLWPLLSPSLWRILQSFDINIFLEYLPPTQRLIVLLALYWFRLHYFTVPGSLFWVQKFQCNSCFLLIISCWKWYTEAEFTSLAPGACWLFPGPSSLFKLPLIPMNTKSNTWWLWKIFILTGHEMEQNTFCLSSTLRIYDCLSVIFLDTVFWRKSSCPEVRTTSLFILKMTASKGQEYFLKISLLICPEWKSY